jgi:predicted RNase H-like nuclease
MVSWTVIGFDSAWTDNAKAPGAVCAIRCDHHGHLSSSDPLLASFDQAFDFIAAEQSGSDVCVVALDQPTIVPNLGGMRPVDKVPPRSSHGLVAASNPPIVPRRECLTMTPLSGVLSNV